MEVAPIVSEAIPMRSVVLHLKMTFFVQLGSPAPVNGPMAHTR